MPTYPCEAIDCDAISRVIGLLTTWIGYRADRSIQMLSVGTECKSKEITLVSFYGEAFFREIGKLVCVQIKYGDRLMSLILLRAVTVVQNCRVVMIRTSRNRSR